MAANSPGQVSGRGDDVAAHTDLAGGEGAILDTSDPNWRDRDPDRLRHSPARYRAPWWIRLNDWIGRKAADRLERRGWTVKRG